MRFLCLLLLASALPAAVTETRVHEIDDTGILLCIKNDSGSDDIQLWYSDESTFSTERRMPTSDASTGWRCLAPGSSIDPGDTIYLKIRVDTGGGFADVDCNTLTNDLTPDFGGGSMTCHASGYFVATMDSDQGVTPTAPSGLPTGLMPTLDTGTTLTASSCSDIATDYATLIAASPDGNPDQIEVEGGVEWTDCPAFTFGTSTNTDKIVLTVDTHDADGCPGPNYRMSKWGDAGQNCYATLRPSALGKFITITNPNFVMSRLELDGPVIGNDTYGEGGDISAVADCETTDLCLTVSSHGLETTPNVAIVVGDPDDPTSCDVAGVYYDTAWANDDSNTIRLPGEAGGACPGGYVYQDPNVLVAYTGGFIDIEADGVLLNQMIFSQSFPFRTQWYVDARGHDDTAFVNSSGEVGNWLAYANGSEQLGSHMVLFQSTNNLFQVEPEGGVGVDGFVTRNNAFIWEGAWMYGGDDFGPGTDNFSMRKHIATWPDERVAADATDDPKDGIVGVVAPARGWVVEFKNGRKGEMVGVMQIKPTNAPSSQNTPPGIVVLKNKNSGATTSVGQDWGTRDWRVESVVGYKTTYLFAIEGAKHNPNANHAPSVAGRFLITNSLLNQAGAVDELGNDVDDFSGSGQQAGALLYGSGVTHDLRIEKTINFKPLGRRSWLESPGTWKCNRCQAEDLLLLGESRSQSSQVFARLEGGANQRPTVTPGSTEGAEAFYQMAKGLDSTNSYVRDIGIVCGRESKGTDFSVTSDGNRITNTECATQYTSTSYTYESVNDYTSAAGTSIQSDIDDVGCDAYFDCPSDDAVDPDKLRADIGLIGIYTGKDAIMAPERCADMGCTANDDVKFYFRAPDADNDCEFKHHPVGSPGSVTVVTVSSGARDRAGVMEGAAGTAEKWWLQCEGSPDRLDGVWTPGGSS